MTDGKNAGEKNPAEKNPAEKSTAGSSPAGKTSGEKAAAAKATAVTETPTPASVRKPSWLRLTVVVIFALFYAYDLFEAIANFFGKVAEIDGRNEVRVLNGFAPIDIPWVFLVANLLLPIVVFLVASLIGRRRGVAIHAIVYLAGLGVVAALSLTLVNFVLVLY